MEETKLCKKCGRELPLTHEYWTWHNKAKGTYFYICRDCRKEYDRKRMEEIFSENGERLEKIRQQRKEYEAKNKDKIREYNRIKNGRRYWGDEEYSKRTGWKLNESGVSQTGRTLKTYDTCNAELYREKTRKYIEANKEKCREKHKKYIETNREKIAKTESAYRKNRYHTDPLYKFQCHLRNTINQSFTRYETYKPRKNKDVIGMTSAELRDYLLKTFKDTYGYEWDQKEPVHIDHIVPLSTAETQEDIVRLCHYTNLRLLKAHDNISKGASQDYQIGSDVSC